MLTKKMLRFKTKKGAIKPSLLELDAKDSLNLAENMLKRIALGQRQVDLNEAWEGFKNSIYYQAFHKIISNACSWQEVSGWEKNRWTYLREAQTLRFNSKSEAEFQKLCASHFKEEFINISNKLYCDLPENCTLAEKPQLDPRQVLMRYNTGQVQGLLLRSQEIRFILPELSIELRRALWQRMRFHHLVADVQSQDNGLDFKLAGPLQLLDSSQKYGLKLAMFFPCILHLPQWRLEAEVNIDGKDYQLSLENDSRLRSHYRKITSYRPEEFSTLEEDFKKKVKDWTISVGGDFFHLGYQADCFPDFVLKNSEGQALYLELFHRWQGGALRHRLEVVAKSKDVPPLLIGVERRLAEELKTTLDDTPWFANNGFVFREFPTAQNVRKLLARRET